MDENFNINPDIVDREEGVARRDPFAEEWGGIAYLHEAGKLNLNKLLHLAPYSEVLLVSGPEGVGKSILLNQFAVSANKSWKVVHIRASSLMTSEEFLRQIVHGFGLPAADVDDIEEMLVEIGRHLQALGRSGRRAIVVIDDLHLLADEAIVIVEHILSDEHSSHALSLVLGVDDGAVAASRLDNFPVLLHKLAYTLRLEPLSEVDVAGYIHHRLLHSGRLDAEPLFNAALVRRLHSKSGGLPSQVNELASRHLDKKGGRKGAVAATDGRKLVRWGLLLLGSAAVGAVLLFQERINQLVAPPPTGAELVAELAVPAAEETAAVTEGKEGEVPESSGESAPALSMGQLGSPSEGQAPTAPTMAEAAPQAAAKVEGSKPEPLPATQPQPVAPANAVAEAAPVTAVAKAPEKIPEKIAAKTAEKIAATSPAKGQEQGWLQAQNPQHFTLQLMALLDEAEVRQFVKSHQLQGQSEIFYITRKGKRLTALVYGSYPDRAAVDAAAQALPSAWGVKDPWVRTFASVNKDLKPN